MKFDTVIGNPPYNNDMYIDFVNLGHKLLRKDGVEILITPAKWQAKGGEKNGIFREKIVPYMKEIVYYPDTAELFDISEPAGITYYLIEKDKKFENKLIINRCEKQYLFNNKLIRPVGLHLQNVFEPILEKVYKHIGFKPFTLDTNIEYWISCNECKNLSDIKNDDSIIVIGSDMYGDKVVFGYYNYSLVKNVSSLNKYKVVMHFKTAKGYATLDTTGKALGIKKPLILGPNEITKDSFLVLKIFDSYDEALSFQSYLNTKFARVLLYCGCCGANGNNPETWRFLAEQEKYDKIFTDDELYKEYGLTESEINIIENTIRTDEV